MAGPEEKRRRKKLRREMEGDVRRVMEKGGPSLDRPKEDVAKDKKFAKKKLRDKAKKILVKEGDKAKKKLVKDEKEAQHSPEEKKKFKKKEKGKLGKLKKRDKKRATADGATKKGKAIHPSNKIHDLTNAPLAGVTSEATPGQRTGATNENIWQDPSVAGAASSSELGDFVAQAQAEAAKAAKAACPCVEGLRNRLTWKSRKHLQELLRQPAPLVSWERWQATCKLQEYLAAVRGGGREKSKESKEGEVPWRWEPLLPDNSNFVEKGLVGDLQRCAGKNDCPGIARKMSAHAATMAKSIRAREAKCTSEGGVKKCKDGEVVVVNHKHTYDIYLKLDKKRLLKLNTQHYKKLQKMYGAQEGAHHRQFHIDLYNMMSRYNALSGHGMQAALPEQVFGLLRRTLGCELECFASPLNSRYAKFCSAFYDTDRRFGAIGDFFTATAAKRGEGPVEGMLRQWMMQSGGSYQMNPPFIENIMRQTATRVDEILDQSVRENKGATPLSFAIFLPGWKESEAIQKLLKSKFLSKAILIAAKEHGYVSGAQHQRKDRYLDSPFDTYVFVLQNAGGKAKWSVAGDFEQDLRKAFASAVPTEAMRERRLKEGRGYSDFDGGGGVYKGKKKKDKVAEGLDEHDKEKVKEKDTKKRHVKEKKAKERDRWGKNRKKEMKKEQKAQKEQKEGGKAAQRPGKDGSVQSKGEKRKGFEAGGQKPGKAGKKQRR